MIRLKLVLATGAGAVSFAFIAVGCSSTPSRPGTAPQQGRDAEAPVADSASPAEDVTVAADSASPPPDSSVGADSGESDDDAAVCVGCASRLSVNGPTAPTCTTNGPPSSHQLLDDWGKCLCQPTTCTPTCEVCTNGQAAVTQACINCGQQACPSQYAACAADTIGFTDDAGD
jgi:hypothetical protein